MDYQLNEPLESFGSSSWTEKKLDAFEKYVSAYLKIMHAQKKKSGWPRKIIYFDGFAGSGINSYNSKDLYDCDKNQLDLLYESEGIDVYKGAAERVIKMSQKFDHYFFVDIDNEAIKKLQDKLTPFKSHGINFTFLCEDVNVAVDKLISELNMGSSGLVLFDPFGMQLKWESIKKFKGKRVDLWILIPSGVAVNRLLKQNGEILSPKILEEYYGLSEDELKQHFYWIQQEQGLFERIEKIEKISESVKKCADLYIERLKGIWKFVTEKPLVLRNSKNVPIYHFVFATNNQTAKKIASEIIGKTE